jgi:two-component system, NtrC family, response regulator HydG
MVLEGSFRSDLYYRISAYPILVPTLRERCDDILLLAESLLARVRPGQPFVIDEAARRALVAYDYPGNVRELRNIVERASLLADDARIELRHLPPEVVTPRTGDRATLADSDGDASGRALRSAERDALVLALARHDGSRRALAETLGISERTLYRKLQVHGLNLRRRETGRS